jgi:hypothetical protein
MSGGTPAASPPEPWPATLARPLFDRVLNSHQNCASASFIRCAHNRASIQYGSFWQIVLQKSKVASVRIFGETLKREAIDDSYYLSGVTEVAYEFSVRR